MPACGRSTTTTPADASSVTRDYRFELIDRTAAPPLLTVLGGKLTTYRRLAEAALAKLAPHLPPMRGGMDRRRGRCPAAISATMVRRLHRALVPSAAGLRARVPRAARAPLRDARRRCCSADARGEADLGAALGGGLTNARCATSASASGRARPRTCCGGAPSAGCT